MCVLCKLFCLESQNESNTTNSGFTRGASYFRVWLAIYLDIRIQIVV